MQQSIICPQCGSPNALGQRSCWNCGTLLQDGCPNCGAMMDPGSRFCGNCGAQLPAAPGVGGGQPQQPAGWGQQPQQGGWQGQPQQPAGWDQQPQQGGWQGQPQQQAGWGQPMPGQRSGGGATNLVILLVVLLIGLGVFAYFAFISDNPPWSRIAGTGGTTTNVITEGPLVFVKSIDDAGGKANMEITWTTAGSYRGQIEYGTSESYGSTTQLEASSTTSHVASLPNLNLSTSFNYRIVLKNADNEEWKSNNFTFKTPAGQEE